MSKIHQLSDHIIAQIAAGEVIERPAYAIKELIENSIDAGADHIQIILEEAGLKKIMIIDNGQGMDIDDIRECYKHHTTSKLIDSLIGIKSFGFRGEALSSIASISSMTIKSKQADTNLGTRIELQNGKFVSLSSVGMPQGTVITIRDLFHAVPARKKFLKSSRVEFRHILDIILQTVIAYPSIRFELLHNNKSIIDLPKTYDLYERVKYLFGTDIAKQMLPVGFTDSFITLSGYISTPHIVSTTTAKQYIFVNNRHVTDKGISQAVKAGYGRLLDATSYPLFVMFLSLPFEMVDVNVHPRKEQIALVNTEVVYSTITRAVEELLKKNNITYMPSIWRDARDDNMPAYATTLLKDRVLHNEITTQIMPSSDILQIHDLYLVTPTRDGFMLFDQHAAHERILFEEYVNAFLHEKKQSTPFPLTRPVIVDKPLLDKTLLTEMTTTLHALQFRYESFGEDHLKITHIPLLFKDHNISYLFTEILSEIQQNSPRDIDLQSQKMLTYLACRSAIKAGEALTKKQAKELVEKLDQTENNQTCPHGRPTRIAVPLRDLHKLFKRV